MYVSILEPTESSLPPEQYVYETKLFSTSAVTPSSGIAIEVAKSLKRATVDWQEFYENSRDTSLVSTVKHDLNRVYDEVLFTAQDVVGENWRKTMLETARDRAHTRWLDDARKQLDNIDVGADEEGLESHSREAREFADKFISVLAEADLPFATVFADDDRGVSIQMEVSGFCFLLTCFEGGNGIYNVAQTSYSLAGGYKSLSFADLAQSEFMQHLRCLIKPLTKDANHNDRPK